MIDTYNYVLLLDICCRRRFLVCAPGPYQVSIDTFEVLIFPHLFFFCFATCCKIKNIINLSKTSFWRTGASLGKQEGRRFATSVVKVVFEARNYVDRVPRQKNIWLAGTMSKSKSMVRVMAVLLKRQVLAQG